MENINELKQKSKVICFASVLGKSTIDKDSFEYKTIEAFTAILLKNGYGIIHGGYAGGAMQATSDATNKYIKENSASLYLNIGVPQIQHDGLWDRVENAQFTDVADDIFQRIKIVTSGDIAVICPLGGDGTELEETIVFHENVVRMGMNKYGGHNLKMTPLIFFQTQNGTDWKTLIQKKIDILDVSAKDVSEYNWLYFIDSLEEFEKFIIKLKTT